MQMLLKILLNLKTITWLIHFSTDHVYDQNKFNKEDDTKIKIITQKQN